MGKKNRRKKTNHPNGVNKEEVTNPEDIETLRKSRAGLLFINETLITSFFYYAIF